MTYNLTFLENVFADKLAFELRPPPCGPKMTDEKEDSEEPV